MTVLCVNCGAPAEFYVNDPGVNPLDYCSLCLPNQWRDRVLAGHLPDSQTVDPDVRTKDNKPFGEFAVHQADVAARFAVEQAGPPLDQPEPTVPLVAVRDGRAKRR